MWNWMVSIWTVSYGNDGLAYIIVARVYHSVVVV